jgi:hypothetical protein
LKKATAQLTGTIREFLSTYKIHLNDQLQENTAKFEFTLATTMDTMIQDLHKAANNGHKAMMEHHD